jgi:hypothetical protein
MSVVQTILFTTKLSAQEIENAVAMIVACIMEKAIAVLLILKHASF